MDAGLHQNKNQCYTVKHNGTGMGQGSEMQFS
jgi:hypothetical protein